MDEWEKGVPEDSFNQYIVGYKLRNPFLTYDGRTLYFSAMRPDANNFDIYCSKIEGSKFTKPEQVSVISSEYDDISPSLSADNLTIYFARYNAENDCFSIYSSRMESSGWSLPQILPPPVNTGCENFVCVSPTGESIIFLSDRPVDKKKKKYNLFSSTMTGKAWLPPVLTEESANEYNDACACISGNIIYMITGSYSGNSLNIGVHETARRIVSKPYTIIKGTVKDTDGKTVDADITVRNSYTYSVFAKTSTDPATGKYAVILPNDGIYSLSCKKKYGAQKFETVNTSDNIAGKILNKDMVIAEKMILYLNIRDELSNKPIDVEVKAFDKNKTAKVFHLETGKYRVEIPLLEKTEIETGKRNYIKQNININPSDNIEFHEMYYNIIMKPEMRSGKLKITDLNTNQGINADVSVKNLDLKDEKIFILNPDAGIYDFQTRKENRYSVSVMLKGYLYYYSIWNVDAGISRTLEIKPVPLGETSKVPMQNLKFKQGESTLTEEACGELDCVVKVLKDNPEYNAVISLYYLDTEKELALQRIRSVVSYFDACLIPKTRYKIETGIAADKYPDIDFIPIITKQK